MRTFIKNIALRLNMTRAENTPFLCNAELNRIMDEEETNNLLTGSGTKDEIRAATHRALDEPRAGLRSVVPDPFHGVCSSHRQSMANEHAPEESTSADKSLVGYPLKDSPYFLGDISKAQEYLEDQMRFGTENKSLDELTMEALHVEALHENAIFDMMRSGGNTALIQELIASGKPVAVDIPEVEGRNPTLDRPREITVTPLSDASKDFIADQLEHRRTERLRILEKVLDGNTEIVGIPNEEPVRIDLTQDMLDLPEEPTGEGLKFIKQIHNEFFATAWNWHRESKAHGKTNYAKHHRFFFLVGERVHNDDWDEISKLESKGFTVGYDKTLDRVTVVVNDVSVWVDMKGVVAELEKAKGPDWNRLTGLK